MSNPPLIDPHSRINPSGPPSRPAASKPAVVAGEGFAELLRRAGEDQGIKFSNHAQKRLQSRDIQLTEDGLQRLAQAVEKAGARGGRESLVLMDDLAFIVNVPDRLVVTALNAHQRGEGVFTQIDSVVLADAPATQVREA